MEGETQRTALKKHFIGLWSELIKVVLYVPKKFFILIIEMKSQSKMTDTKLSFIKPPKGALPYGGAFLHGEREENYGEDRRIDIRSEIRCF